MKAVIQRVSEANVKVDGNIVGEISKGLLLLIGIDEEDEKNDADWLVQKIFKPPNFGDEGGKLNRSVMDILRNSLHQSIHFDCGLQKGKRISFFIKAAKPEKAIPIFEYFKPKSQNLD